jgi:site-specific DNA-methyltransferase (adenine-specific)
MRTRIRNGEYTTREWSDHFSKKYAHFRDDLPVGAFYEFHRRAMKEMLRVSPLILYNIQIVTGSKEAFFKLIGTFRRYIKDIIDWQKNTEQPAMHSQVLNAAHELILVMQSPAEAGRAIKHGQFKRGELSNHWKGIGRGESFNGHGATFPLELARKAILNFSLEEQTVYDPFAGLGSTLIAAHQLGRNWIGSEISAEYVELANKRLEPYLMQEQLF